jgi:hypothetical protein
MVERHITSSMISPQTMNTINELDAVALTCDLPAHGLQRGDVGSAVLVHGEGAAFEVGFVGYDGHTVALVTPENSQVRPAARQRHPARPFAGDRFTI